LKIITIFILNKHFSLKLQKNKFYLYYNILLQKNKYPMWKVPSLNLSIRQGILFVVSIAILLTIMAYFSEHKEIKTKENRLSYKDKIFLYMNRLYHYSSTIIIMFFPFIFTSGILQDSFYLFYLLGVYLSWREYRECPISIIEKQMLDKSYKMGENPEYEPYTALIFNAKNKNEYESLQKAIVVMYYVNLIIVGYREVCGLYTYITYQK